MGNFRDIIMSVYTSKLTILGHFKPYQVLAATLHYFYVRNKHFHFFKIPRKKYMGVQTHKPTCTTKIIAYISSNV